jgi:hypothetical protein
MNKAAVYVILKTRQKGVVILIENSAKSRQVNNICGKLKSSEIEENFAQMGYTKERTRKNGEVRNNKKKARGQVKPRGIERNKVRPGHGNQILERISASIGHAERSKRRLARGSGETVRASRSQSTTCPSELSASITTKSKKSYAKFSRVSEKRPAFSERVISRG